VAALTIAATTDKGPPTPSESQLADLRERVDKAAADKAADKSVTRWEYSVELEYFKHADPEYARIHTTQLNTLASKGWEVVCSHTILKEAVQGTREIVLKRAKK
jgi:hypothetical protein